MWIEQILKDDWWKMAIGYGVLFYLYQYITYNIIFRTLVGQPRSLALEDIRYWRRKANFIGAVFFAPLFEEFMITLLAYASFLRYARDGQEGVVILMVAVFFALLHIPADVHHQRNSRFGIRPFSLLFWQFDRFFYSLAAYFLYKTTGTLWSSIILHYLVNGLASVYNFDMEDGIKTVGAIDLQQLIIFLLKIGIVLFGSYQFYQVYPQPDSMVFYIAFIFLITYFSLSLRFVKTQN